VPPRISDSGTVSDVVAAEGVNASMVCKARGFPEPNISWSREDEQQFIYNGNLGKKNSHKIILKFFNTII